MVVHVKTPRGANAGAVATEGTTSMTQEAYRQLPLDEQTAADVQPTPPDSALQRVSEPVSPTTDHQSARVRTDANEPQSHATQQHGRAENPLESKPQPDRSPSAVETQRSRSRANCDCGSACFYCGRVLSANRHEHDHFPVPARHGGDSTVPACRECHTLKDRCVPIGMRRDWTVDVPVWKSIESGLGGLRSQAVDAQGDSVPLVLFTLYECMTEWGAPGHLDGDLDLGDYVESLGRWVAHSTPQCTTPEARLFLATLFTTCLDILDRALQTRPVS